MEGEKMQILVGVLATLCFVLTAGLVLGWKKFNSLNYDIQCNSTALSNIYAQITRLPAPVQNIIHLEFKNPNVDAGVGLVKMSVRPEDFELNVERLRTILLHGFETKEHPDMSTRAYTILDHAGLDKVLENKSWSSCNKALTRLLINGDDRATRRFLETLADSVAMTTTAPL